MTLLEQTIQAEFLSPEDISKILLVDISTVYRYINLEEGALPSFKLSKKVIRVKKADLYKWIDENANKYGI